jgi:diguanylate cyclase (GGDEF)-like protein
VVAEGIETLEELRTVMRVGLHYGQGYYLARPAAPPPGLSAGVERTISRVHSLFGATSEYAGTVASLTEPAPVVLQDVAAREVAALLKGEEGPEGVVVVAGDRCVGLVMMTRLYRQLGVKYGVPLYYDRPVALLMDRTPLVVEGSTSLDEAARMATLREHRKRYDLVVVVDQGRYCGVVQVHRLLSALAEERFYVARRTNPLTDLPGNRLIQEALSRRQASGRAYSVIYADLDAFKVYNDNYGFEQGDAVLAFTAALMRKALVRHGSGDDFLGHIGGDDFILIVAPERVAAIGRYVLAMFDRVVSRFYSSADRQQEALEGYDRQGRPVLAPLMGLSVAVLDCLGGEVADDGRLGARVAALKREAKAAGGSRLVRGRLEQAPLLAGEHWLEAE